MPQRVVFFLGTTLSRRDSIRFGFDIIRARGYTVEAWNFSPVLRPDYYKSYTPPDTIDFSGLRSFTHRQHIVDAVADLSNDDVVVCLIGLDLDSAFIFELLKRKNIFFGFCRLGFLPKASHNQRIKKQFYRAFSSPAAFLGKILSHLRLCIRTRMPRSQLAVSHNFVMTGGEAATKDHICLSLDATKILKAHAFDYDRYLEEEKRTQFDEATATGSCALFLDEDVPFHPDYLHNDISPYCTAGRYYGELNNFFDSFERATGLPIIVSAHPRADYAKRGNPYGSRKLVFGETTHYTKYSKLILAHASTALNFAILYKKPVLFLESAEYSMPFRQQIRDAAAAIGQKPAIVSEEPLLQLKNLSVNGDLYEQYKHAYIKEIGTPDKMCWDIFCDYIDKMDKL